MTMGGSENVHHYISGVLVVVVVVVVVVNFNFLTSEQL
jgi:hypothetical protein